MNVFAASCAALKTVCPENSFIIRKAEKDDAEAIKSIIDVSFRIYMEKAGLTGTMEALEETVEDIERDIENKEVYIAFVDGEPAGTIRVETRPDGTAYISRFGVKPGYNNLGIGSSLINRVEDYLKTRSVRRVYLHTASRYTELVCFYYRRGFYVDSTTKDRGYVRALMVKEL